MRSYSYCQKSWKNTKQSTTKMGSNRVSTLCVDLVPGLRVRACGRERSKHTTSTRGRTVLCQKEYYLSASQARPMLTTGAFRSGLTSVTHDETRVKSSCFHKWRGPDSSPRTLLPIFFTFILFVIVLMNASFICPGHTYGKSSEKREIMKTLRVSGGNRRIALI